MWRWTKEKERVYTADENSMKDNTDSIDISIGVSMIRKT